MLVSIVIPTKLDREDLFKRALDSVVTQDWPGPVEIIAVADLGSDLYIRYGARSSLTAAGPARDFRLVELNDTWRDGVRDRSIGAVPWMVGSLCAAGDVLGFLGDDDELHPDHIRRHMAALTQPGVDFTIGPVRFCVGGQERFVIGDASFAHGHLDSDGIMCHATALKVASWTATGEDAADFRMVRDWRTAGLHGVYIGGEPTATHHDGWAAR